MDDTPQVSAATGDSLWDMLARNVAEKLDRTVCGDEHLDNLTTSVQKFSHLIPMSREMAMDYGLIPADRPPYVPTRRERFRWWRQERVYRLRMRLASWVAGFDVEDR